MTDRLPPDLCSGFEEMDAQHVSLLRKLRAAQAAARSGNLPAVQRAVSALSDELVAHFEAEDRWMGAAGFPERSRHHAAHDLFLQDLARVTPALASGAGGAVLEWLSVRAPEWIAFHIRVNDVPLGRFLSARASRPADARRSGKSQLS